MNERIERADHYLESLDEDSSLHDYAQVKSIARIALYDDLRSAPRITKIYPAPTAEFIENLSSKIYEQAKLAGGGVPYTVIREVTENFIHARFAEAIVSILDGGNTIRFSDQGPGIPYKEKAQLPGFTSAVEPMKRYIRGVGSGLPIVKDYLDFSHGTISIEDNLGTGAVVTISLVENQGGYGLSPENEDPYLYDDRPRPHTEGPDPAAARRQAPFQEPIGRTPYHRDPSFSRAGSYEGALPRTRRDDPHEAYPDYGEAQGQPLFAASAYGRRRAVGPSPSLPGAAPFIAPLSQRERDFLPIFLNEGALGVTDLSRLTGVPQSSTYFTLSKLEQAGLIEKTVGQKRILTDLGYHVANSL